MMEYQTAPNEDMFVRLQLKSSDTGLYPQATIRTISAPTVIVDTVNLVEVANGLYGLVWTNNGQKTKYFTQTIVYTDSGHTTVHSTIRPDSDSINVGFNASGFSIGSKSAVYKHKLTKEEILKIAKACYKLIKPELAKKSEFNPNKDKVKTDIVIPKVKIPPFPEMPTVYDIAKAIRNTLDIDGKIKGIKFPQQKEAPTLKEIVSIIEPIILKNGIDYSKFEELKRTIIDNKVELPDQTDNNKAIKSIVETANGIIEVKMLEDVIKKLGSDITKEDVFKAIDKKSSAFNIYQLIKKLPAKDKKEVFNQLFIENKLLLNELDKLANVENIVNDIDKSNNKTKTFKSFLAKGQLSKNMLPLIRLFKQNA